MKKTCLFMSILLLMIFMGQSCRKTEITQSQSNISSTNLGPIVKKSNVVNPGYTEYPLTNNGNGTFTGYIYGEEVTFSNIICEVLTNSSGNNVAPKDGDPFYADLTFTTPVGMQWTMIVSPDAYAANNQFVIQVPVLYTSVYNPGPQISNFWADMDTYHTNYVNQMSAVYNLISNLMTNLWAICDTTTAVSITARPTYNPPTITSYLNTSNTSQPGNRLITGYLIRKSDFSFAIRIMDIPLT